MQSSDASNGHSCHTSAYPPIALPLSLALWRDRARNRLPIEAPPSSMSDSARHQTLRRAGPRPPVYRSMRPVTLEHWLVSFRRAHRVSRLIESAACKKPAAEAANVPARLRTQPCMQRTISSAAQELAILKPGEPHGAEGRGSLPVFALLWNGTMNGWCWSSSRLATTGTRSVPHVGPAE